MSDIILNPSDKAHWHALVNEAELSCDLQLPEEVESYMVFLLMRFVNQAEISGGTLAVDFLEGLNESGKKRQDMMQAVGDKCLLFSGFFPGNAKKRRVSITYFVSLGRTAYYELSRDEKNSESSLFCLLYQNFVSLMDLLQTIRESTGAALMLPLEALELWQETGSQKAKEVLEQYSDLLPIIKKE